MKDSLLSGINSPSDLRALDDSQIPELSAELRSLITSVVTENGGHLASNLGVVELTLAIHRVFDTPRDKVIFDVGHQAYAHKIITGRRDAFPTIRRPGGLSGFTKRSESEYDPFGAGHSSTSVSAAIAFAEAAALNGTDEYAVAVIGDGALTGGLALEALNNINKDRRLIIILNDNEMSISPITGRVAKYLSKIRTSSRYHRTKRFTRKALRSIPLIGKHLFGATVSIKQAFKNLFFKSNFFEDLGLYYLGPVDGHDYKRLKSLLLTAKEYNGACVVHVRTTKGKGYAPAEQSPHVYHGVSPASSTPPERNFSSEMGELLCERAQKDARICAITAAMADGCGLSRFAKEHPDRFFDVGIAEEHAAVFAAGLAASGKRPVFAVYSSFLQRAYDNIIHDIALQSLPVTVCIDRAGLSASDGPTHHGIFDVAMLCQIPHVALYAPVTYRSLERALDLALDSTLPSFIRYANSDEMTLPESLISSSFFAKDFDDPSKCDCFIVLYGRLVKEALAAKEALSALSISCGIILIEKLLPLSEPLAFIEQALAGAKADAPLLFAEEAIQNGSLSSCLHSRLAMNESFGARPMFIKAIDDCFGNAVKGQTPFSSCGISGADLAATLIHALGKDS